MDFAKLLGDTWESFVADIVHLVLFTLVGFLLCFTLILIPTVWAGWFRGALGLLRDGTRPDFEELWSFEQYFDVLLLMVVGFVAITIGYICLIVPGVILSVWWLYALVFVVDQDMGFIEAMGASKDAVSDTGFVNNLIVLLITSVLAAIGGSLSGLGALLTTPFAILFVTLIYLDLPGAENSEVARFG